MISFFAQSSAEMSIGGFLFSNHSPLSIVTFFLLSFFIASLLWRHCWLALEANRVVCVLNIINPTIENEGNSVRCLENKRELEGQVIDIQVISVFIYIPRHTQQHKLFDSSSFSHLSFLSLFFFFFLFRLSYVNINQHAMGFSSIGQVLACI